ncbi:MAG: hypothetical protein QGG19_12410 [Alphaproteobacteria bacterium]|nr:hypothetical protein [Alphaproteobacteria bacterium]MDP6255010.1 hypothetical protein [Alphaproteobacteria bacterium]MDP7053327.1 hypothetical protein [Alphaproteobacteria bacterium]MDP7228865.1 hypothetical protein [Alphaproteobacteria bacterium]MDP7459115.1 hypothetical protein [Alphaproteobacteria bacterium]
MGLDEQRSVADALSTALYLTPPKRAADLKKNGGGQEARLRQANGALQHLRVC